MLLQAPAASGLSDGTTPMAKAKGTKIAARQQEQVGPPCCPPWVGTSRPDPARTETVQDPELGNLCPPELTFDAGEIIQGRQLGSGNFGVVCHAWVHSKECAAKYIVTESCRRCTMRHPNSCQGQSQGQWHRPELPKPLLVYFQLGLWPKLWWLLGRHGHSCRYKNVRCQLSST